MIVSWWSVRSPSRARFLSSEEKASPCEAVTGWLPSDGEICAAQSGGTFATDKQVLPGLALLLQLSTSRFPRTGNSKYHHEIILQGCGSVRSRGPRNNGGHTTDSFDQVLKDYTTEAGVDHLKLWVISAKGIPDVPEIRKI